MTLFFSSKEKGVPLNGETTSDDDDSVRRKKNGVPLGSIFTLFVDDIQDRLDYHHVRGIFAQIGRVVDVFIQGKRNIGRLHRFAFVRFFHWRLHLRRLASSISFDWEECP